MEIKREHAWLETELHSISRIDSIGAFSRKLWHEAKARPDFKAFWGELPLWFRQEAKEVLGGKFTPRPKKVDPLESELQAKMSPFA